MACSKTVREWLGRLDGRTRRPSSAVTVGFLPSPPLNGLHLEPIHSPSLPVTPPSNPPSLAPFHDPFCLQPVSTDRPQMGCGKRWGDDCNPGPERKPHPGDRVVTDETTRSHRPPQMPTSFKSSLSKSIPCLQNDLTAELIMERTARAPFRRRGRGLPAQCPHAVSLARCANCAAPCHAVFTQCRGP